MNDSIFYFFYHLAHQSALLDQIIVFTAVTLPFVVVIIAAVFLLMHHEVFKAEAPFMVIKEKRKEIALVFSSGIAAWFLAVALKFVFHTERPFLALPDVQALFSVPIFSSFSFPSEHMMFFSALSSEVFLIHKKTGFLFLFFTLLIGIARIISGVHFPVDILTGAVLGFLVAYSIKKFTN